VRFVETAALRFEGFTDEQIAQIDAVLPDVEHLLGVLKAELPRINRLIPIAQMAIRTFNAANK
jgi:hypothetical protein